MLSHAEPTGDLGAIIERALDQLIAVETKRRSGAGKPRKHRETRPGSRHVPVHVQRAVRERDGDRCTFTDSEGRRCSANRPSGRAGGIPSPGANGRGAPTRATTPNASEFLTIEHIEPFAKGGLTTADNCCLLCSSHNAYQAQRVFGADHIRQKIAEARARRAERAPAPTETAAVPSELDCSQKVIAGLAGLGFPRSDARRAVEEVRQRGVEPLPEPLLRAALLVLTPDRPGSSSRGRA